MDKQELIDKINRNDLTEEQISEIVSILKGQMSEANLLNKAEKLLSNFFSALKDTLTPHKSILWYRFGVLVVIVGLIYGLALREPENSTQVWTIVGAFIGFIFGQKSSFLRF